MTDTDGFAEIFGDSYMAFFAFFATFFLIIIVVSLVLYVIQAVALMKIAQTAGSDKGWLAWIPIANGFVMPMLVEDDVHESMRGKFTMIYAGALIGSFLLSAFIPFVSFIPTLLVYYAFYLIAKWFSEKHMVHLVVAILTLGISMPFSLFRFRNRKIVKNKIEIIE